MAVHIFVSERTMFVDLGLSWFGHRTCFEIYSTNLRFSRIL